MNTGNILFVAALVIDLFFIWYANAWANKSNGKTIYVDDYFHFQNRKMIFQLIAVAIVAGWYVANFGWSWPPINLPI